MKHRLIFSALLAGAFALLLAACENKNGTDPISPVDDALALETLGKTTGDDVPTSSGSPLGIIGEILNLTEAQKAQITALVEKDHEQMREKFAEEAGNGTFGQMAAERKAGREALFAAILGVLTAEQRAQAEAMKARLDNGQVPQEIIDYHLARLAADLQLSEEQVAQLRALGSALPVPGLLRGPAWRGAPGYSPEDRGNRRAEVRKFQEKLQAILTPEQFAAFQEMQQKRRAAARERFGDRGGRMHRGAPLAWLGQALNLTDEQKEQLKGILEAFRAQHQPGEPLGQPQGPPPPDVMNALHQQIGQILTDEQKAKFRELLAQRMSRRRGRN